MERIKGIWGGTPSGHREACWALVGRLPWRGAIFLAASTSGGTLSRRLVATLAVFGPWCRMNSGWMLSGPGDFPDLSLRIADVISTSVKSLERSESADGALHRSRTLVVCLEKVLSASGNRPLFVSCEAMASAVIGQIDGLLVRPVNLFRVCLARLLEWVKSIDATVSAHLSLRFSSNLRCRFVAAVSLSSSDCVSTPEDVSSRSWLSTRWNEEWRAAEHSRLHSFINTPDHVPGQDLPRRQWTTYNRIRTGVGRFGEAMKRWGQKSTSECECGAPNQSVQHITMHRPPNGERGLIDLDEDTRIWLASTSLEI